MAYNPDGDQHYNALETEEKKIARKKENLASETFSSQRQSSVVLQDDEEQEDCNLVIWGSWKTQMEDPVLLNLDDLGT